MESRGWGESRGSYGSYGESRRRSGESRRAVSPSQSAMGSSSLTGEVSSPRISALRSELEGLRSEIAMAKRQQELEKQVEAQLMDEILKARKELDDLNKGRSR